MFRSRSWFGVGWNKPKNRLSLEHLKYLCTILEKNATVSENNRSLLVESLRSIAEILIWGDQHDSSVFDFFLEKNMLSYFLHIMRQKSGGSSFVCVQLLQTLNILFENIRNETSLYYLLSNNHVNSIIVHKFDFSDEDVMGYYILFLKTLSLKLNTHTIHFFYNEHTNDFPLYTEAIKFFNHPESMVRIAVRTISLNVYKVQNTSMLRFIRDKTAAPYFSNLVWFIGKHILELDSCVRMDIDHQSNQKLSNLVAEHLDHLHYLNDILLLGIIDLNAVLTEHLLHKLFIPLYIYSLTPMPPSSLVKVTQNLAAVLNRNMSINISETQNLRVSSVVAMYLLSLVFLVITHAPLVHALAWVILNGDDNVFKEGAAAILNDYIKNRDTVVPSFAEPRESLEEALDIATASSFGYGLVEAINENNVSIHSSSTNIQERCGSDTLNTNELKPVGAEDTFGTTMLSSSKYVNITDEEKQKLQERKETPANDNNTNKTVHRPFMETVLTALDCTENDYLALLSLCLVYAMSFNRGLSDDWFHQVLSKSGSRSVSYKTKLVESLLNTITLANQPFCRIRLITIEIALELLIIFTKSHNTSDNCSRYITDAQQDILFKARNESLSILRNFYKSEDIFLDLFEDEYNEMIKTSLNVEFLCMDSTILLPPTSTPLTGIPFTRRLPCGEAEKARRAIRIFFLFRRTWQALLNEKEALLPLTDYNSLIQVDNVLDLNNSDLIACTVIYKNNVKQRRFLVIDLIQLILVEPDAKLLGWGVAKYVGFLQDVEVTGDKDDSRCLHITVHRGSGTYNSTPSLSAKFIFDDHIRCMAAKQRLTKGRSKARQKKMYQIAQLIDIPGQTVDSAAYVISGLRSSCTNNHNMRLSRENQPTFLSVNRVPGFAAALRKDNSLAGGVSRIQLAQNRSIECVRNKDLERSRRRNSSSSSTSNSQQSWETRVRNNSNSPGNSSTLLSRDSSPKTLRPKSEEIPLEDFQQSRNNSPHVQPPNDNVTLNTATLDSTLMHTNEAIISQEVRSSKETSFIGTEENLLSKSNLKRKGGVETV